MALIPQAIEDRIKALEDAITEIEDRQALLEEALAPIDIEFEEIEDGDSNIR